MKMKHKISKTGFARRGEMNKNYTKVSNYIIIPVK